MAVGNQRTHPELFSQRYGLTVVVFSFFDIWSTATRTDLAEETECPCLVAALPALR